MSGPQRFPHSIETSTTPSGTLYRAVCQWPGCHIKSALYSVLDLAAYRGRRHDAAHVVAAEVSS